MSDGIRSVAQGWLGGSGSVPVVGSQGVRSIQAFWMGGAGTVPVVGTSGVRSLLAFWMGGASAGVAAPVVIVPESHGSGGGRSSWEREPRPGWDEYTQERQRRYDEVFKKLLVAEQAFESAKLAIAERNHSQVYTAKDRMRLKPLVERVEKLRLQLAKLETDLDEEHLIITLMMH